MIDYLDIFKPLLKEKLYDIKKTSDNDINEENEGIIYFIYRWNYIPITIRGCQ